MSFQWVAISVLLTAWVLRGAYDAWQRGKRRTFGNIQINDRHLSDDSVFLDDLADAIQRSYERRRRAERGAR